MTKIFLVTNILIYNVLVVKVSLMPKPFSRKNDKISGGFTLLFARWLFNYLLLLTA